jgi:hypothetical protein
MRGRRRVDRRRRERASILAVILALLISAAFARADHDGAAAALAAPR